MNTRHKVFIQMLILIQCLVIFKIFPEKVFYKSYAAEIASSIIFSVTKINRLYNFFTGVQATGKYNYVTNNMYMIKGEEDKLEKLPIAGNGLIQQLVSPVNAARISTLPSIATQDTTLYNAIVRSEALFFFNKHKEYPVFYIEVLNHHCTASRQANRFVRSERVDTVYSCYFSLD